jgi:hypothetical protein
LTTINQIIEETLNIGSSLHASNMETITLSTRTLNVTTNATIGGQLNIDQGVVVNGGSVEVNTTSGMLSSYVTQINDEESYNTVIHVSDPQNIDYKEMVINLIGAVQYLESQIKLNTIRIENRPIYYWDFTRISDQYNKEIISNGAAHLDFIELSTESKLRYPVTDIWGNRGIKIGSYDSFSGNTGIGVRAPQVAGTFPKENFSIQITYSVKDDLIINNGQTCDLTPSFGIFYKFGTSFQSHISNENNPSGLITSFNGRDKLFYYRTILYTLNENGSPYDQPTGTIDIPIGKSYDNIYPHTPTTLGQYPLDVSKESQTITITVKRTTSNQLLYIVYIDNYLFTENIISTNPNDAFYYQSYTPFIVINEMNESLGSSEMILKTIKVFNYVIEPDDLPKPKQRLYEFNYHFVSDKISCYNYSANVEYVNTYDTYTTTVKNYVVFTGDINYYNNMYGDVSHLINLQKSDFWIEYDLEFIDQNSVFAIQLFNFHTLSIYSTYTSSFDFFDTKHTGICFGSMHGILICKCGDQIINTGIDLQINERSFMSIYVNQNQCLFYKDRSLVISIYKDNHPLFWNSLIEDVGYFFGLINISGISNRAHFIVKTSDKNLGTLETIL